MFSLTRHALFQEMERWRFPDIGVKQNEENYGYRESANSIKMAASFFNSLDSGSSANDEANVKESINETSITSNWTKPVGYTGEEIARSTPNRVLISIPKNLWELHENSSNRICCGSTKCENNNFPKGKHIFTLNKNKCTFLEKLPCVDNVPENSVNYPDAKTLEQLAHSPGLLFMYSQNDEREMNGNCNKRKRPIDMTLRLEELTAEEDSTAVSICEYAVWCKWAWITRWLSIQYNPETLAPPKTVSSEVNYDDLEISPLKPRRSPLVRRRCAVYAAKRRKTVENESPEDSLSITNTFPPRV